LTHGLALSFLFEWGRSGALDTDRVEAVGHRVVHGGTRFTAACLIDAEIVRQLEALVPLAPLHQPHNVAAIKAVLQMAPGLPQVACFDTAFHRTQPAVARAFALPRRFADEGVQRYGFHGLSYEYIASALASRDRRAAYGRTIVAHLGNGASLCALRDSRSVATTMGFTALDGLVMGTRCGAIDPGVLLYLMAQHGMSPGDLEKLLYEQSGLLGVSGISSDMRTLLGSADPHAQDAIELFLYRVQREFGAMAAVLGGVDAIVFTGGIGEHAPAIRARICRRAGWLGLELDDALNEENAECISRRGSHVTAWVIPADEELMIARHTRRVLARAETPLRDHASGSR
jgi:acetate kinase